jgi:Uma2 family endonuclease
MTAQRMPVEDFKRLVLLPENNDRLFEYVGGEMIEKQTAFYCAVIATRLAVPLGGFVQEHQLGFVTGASCYCSVLDDWYLPTAAYMSKDRQAEPSQEYFVPIPPNLVVEVVSLLNDPAVLRQKLWNYLVAGIVVWVVDPDEKQVEVYVPGQPVSVIGSDGVLEGGDVLPGFAMAVKDLFEF